MISRTRPSLTAICMLLIPIVVAIFNKVLPIPSDIAAQPSAGSVAEAAPAAVASGSPVQDKYVIVASDNPGTQCYNPDFSSLAISPLSSTLVAQLVKVSDPPEIVTVGCRFPENTWSADRQGRQGITNFSWYAKDLFGVSLGANMGLAGKGLAGPMNPAPYGVPFVAEGIPLTDIRCRMR